MADYYGKIGNNRLVKFAAVREYSGGSHLSSDSVRDCRLSAHSSVKIRVKAPVGVTGGAVEASAYQREYENPIRSKKQTISAGKRPRKSVALRNSAENRSKELKSITRNNV